MFKVGQKVVYIGGNNNYNCIPPKVNEVVTLSSFFGEIGGLRWWVISEYPYAKNGKGQAFDQNEFRPLDYDFVEEVIKQVQPEKQPA